MKFKVFAIVEVNADSPAHAAELLERAVESGVATIEVFEFEKSGSIKAGPPVHRYVGGNYGAIALPEGA